MRRIRVAVAGAGALGSIHARVLSGLPEAQLVGVFDVVPERAAAVAKKHRTVALPTLGAVMEVAEACVVAAPTSAHAAVAGELLDAGVACLVEKPLARTPMEGLGLVTRARARGVVLMVGHVERFNPAVMALLSKELAPRFLEAQRVSPFSFRSSDVGVVLDMMIHDIDLILHLVRAPVRDVHAVGISVVGEHEDLANARLVFENGAVANVTASRLALKTERKLRLFAPDCYVTLDFKEKSGRVIRPAPGLREALSSGAAEVGSLNPLEIMLKRLVRIDSLEVSSKDEPLVLEDREFLRAVSEGRDAAVTGEHGVLAMETAERVIRSIRTNSSAP